ncbi:hypothetical protein [Carboxylicivirga marina]|uniref:Ribbon-helix-helix protein CopG domain-containing protein n=1 Tax=Carboxylicivirga marina TaxID=2800988 RepID=A0ABS1HGT6_9BACT|nr:hypothetical protein [Carboxylicivirga marina]MBK3516690.1 hypothetical protein [Carboxylicivirga marina]
MKTERLNIKLSKADRKKIDYLVKRAKTDKSKVIRGLINNAYDLVKSVANEKN